MQKESQYSKGNRLFQGTPIDALIQSELVRASILEFAIDDIERRHAKSWASRSFFTSKPICN